MIDNIVRDPLNNEKSALRDLEILCKTSTDAKQHHFKDFHKAHLEIEFKVNPTCDTYRALKAGMSANEWDRCQTRCCEYVKQNCKSIGVEKCLNVFYQLELFKEMKEFITDLKLDDRSYDKVSEMFNDSCKKSRDQGVKFIAGFHPWLGQLMVKDFIDGKGAKVSEKAKDLLKKVIAFDPTVLSGVLARAIDLFEKHLNKSKCRIMARNSALEWLVDVKNLCKQLERMAEFSQLYHKLMNGILKRKKGLINVLSKCDTGDIIFPKQLQATGNCVVNPSATTTAK